MRAAVLTAEEGQNILLPADYDIIWSAVVFAVLLTFFWFRVLPSFKRMLDERAKAIEGRLAEAEKAQLAAEERTLAVEAEQEKLRAESSSIREEARADGIAMREQMMDEAASERDRFLALGQSQLAAEREATLNALRSEIGELAVELASRIVGEKLKDDAVAARVVDEFIAELEGKRA